MREMRDAVLENQRVLLDGTRWYACTFKGCDLVVSAGETSIEKCHLIDCRVHAEGNFTSLATLMELFSPRKNSVSGTAVVEES